MGQTDVVELIAAAQIERAIYKVRLENVYRLIQYHAKNTDPKLGSALKEIRAVEKILTTALDQNEDISKKHFEELCSRIDHLLPVKTEKSSLSALTFFKPSPLMAELKKSVHEMLTTPDVEMSAVTEKKQPT